MTNRRIFANALRKGGHENVRACKSAREVDEVLASEDVELVIADKNETLVEEQSGEGKLLPREKYGSISVLMVGYDFSEREAVEAIRNGADELLLMPFSPEELNQRVEKLTNGKAKTPDS